MLPNMAHFESLLYARSDADDNIKTRWIAALVELLKKALRNGQHRRAREIERDIELAEKNL